MVCKSFKTSYGLEQASRCSNRTFVTFKPEFTPKCSTIDYCGYSKRQLHGNRMFICLWLDDIKNFPTFLDLRVVLKSHFSQKFQEKKRKLNEVVFSCFSWAITWWSQNCYKWIVFLSFSATSEYKLCDVPVTADTKITKSHFSWCTLRCFKNLSKVRSLYLFTVGKLNYP